MPYPEEYIRPMREELTAIGIAELRDAASVDSFFGESARGLSLLVVNSMCGCAAGNARPAVARALNSPHAPERLGTVFAGQDLEATARAREHLAPIPPSSPFIAVLRDGKPVFIQERHHIKGRPVAAIAAELEQAFDHLAGADVEMPVAGATGGGPEWQAPGTFRSIL